MKKLLPFLGILALCGCSQQGDMAKVANAVKEIKSEFAPDKRVALFQIDSIYYNEQIVVKGMTNLPAAKSAFLKKMAAAGLPFEDSISLLPAPNLQGKHFGLVNVSVCNLRSKPKHSAELATQAWLGATLRVWKKEGDFYLVQSPDGYFGWLDDGGFVLADSLQIAQWRGAERLLVIRDFGSVLTEKNPSAQKISDLTAGNTLQLIENQGSWYKISLPDGRKGYVVSDQATPLNDWLASRSPTAEKLLNTANEMMGRPYLWGGTSGKGMDCSGFTKMAFLLNGIDLPRDASQQAYVGQPIQTDSTLVGVQPGDLLFFGKRAEAGKKEKITHVAIHIGDGRIIHASDRVKTESLQKGDPDFNQDRLNTLVRCARVLGAGEETGVKMVGKNPYF